jgi:molybdate transport system substrate-binding protein
MRMAGTLTGVKTLGIAALGALLVSCGRQPEPEAIVLCGGSMRAGIEALVEQYKEAHPNAKVFTSYGGSGELMAQLRETGKGDIYVCHDPFMEWGLENDLIAEYETVGRLRIVIVVPKGNPKGIRGVQDLAKPGVRLGLGDERYSTSGVMTKQLFDRVPYGDSVRANVITTTKGHQQRASDIAIGSLDASVVWNAVAAVFADKLDTVSIPDTLVDAVTSATYGTSNLRNVRVTIGLTRTGAPNSLAKDLYAYMKENAPAVLVANGFSAPLEAHDGAP